MRGGCGARVRSRKPLPGGLGAPLVRHYDRSARSSLHWRRGGASRSHPVIPGNAARAESGVTAWREPQWSAERRARPAWTRGHARSANRWQHLLEWRGPTGQSRLSALRLPSFYLEAATVLAFVRKTRMRMHRENEIAY